MIGALTDCPKSLALAVVRNWSIRLGGAGLFVLLALSLLSTSLHPSAQTLAPGDGTTNPKEGFEPARLSGHVSVRTAGRGDFKINLSDGREVLTAYEGPEELRLALQQNQAQPLALASADFDEDGVVDLVSGYAYKRRGIITLLRGNADAIYPNTPEAQQRRASGATTESPFLSPARVFRVPVAADFIGAGDFDADGHSDVVAASRSDSSLYLMSGDGHGNFAPAREIALPGLVTAMATGDLNRPDGLTDVIVGINGAVGSKVMVFEGPEGALRSSPEIFVTHSPVASLVVGQLDDDQQADLAIAAGRELLVVGGRDRKLSLNDQSRAQVEPAAIAKRTFGVPIRSLVAGDFTGSGHQNLALLSDDGVVHLLDRESGQQAADSIRAWTEDIAPIAVWPSVIQLVCARISGLPIDDLIGVDSLGHQLQVLTRVPAATGALLDSGEFDFIRSRPQGVSLTEVGTPVAVLPLRVNGDALSDLVVLRSGSSAPSIRLSAANAIITVNSTADTNTRDDVLTLREAILLANGELLKSSLTAAEQPQVNGAPAPGLDEVRFNIPVNAQASLNANEEVNTANKRTTTPGKQAAAHVDPATAARSGLPDLSGISNNSYLTNQLAAKTIETTENRSLSFSLAHGTEREYGPRLSWAETRGPDSMAPMQDNPTQLPTSTTSIQSPEPTSNSNARWRAEGLLSMLHSFRRYDLFHQPTTDCVLSPINVNQAVSGNLANTDCQSPIRGSGYFADRYAFTGTTNQAVAIRASASYLGVVHLLGPDGLVVASNGLDFSFTTTPRIPAAGGFLALPANGTYTIEVTSYSTNITGNYSLSLTSGTAGCSYGITTPSSQSFNAGGGNGNIAVTTGGVCGWTAITDANWVTINTGSSGTGSGTVNYTIAVNSSGSPRTANVFVAGLVFSITQLGDASGCSATSLNLNQVVNGSLANTDCQSPIRGSGYFADRYTFTGTTNQAVAIRESASYLGVVHLLGPNGLIVASNGLDFTFTNTPRIPAAGGFLALPANGTYTIEVTSYSTNVTGNYGLSLTSGTAGCSYGITTPSSQSFNAAGGSGNIAVTTGGVCAWTAITDANWVTINTGSSGTGSGTVNYTIAVNPSGGPRTANVFVAGLVFSITQLGDAGGCAVTSLNLNQVVIGSLANTDCQSPIRGSGYFADRYAFTGTTNQAVAIRASASYLGVVHLLGPDGLVVASNGLDFSFTTTPRIPAAGGFLALPANGTYTIEVTSYSTNMTGSYSLSLTSGTAGCSYGITTPSSQSFNAGGGNGNIAVTTGGVCGWTAITDANWVTINTGSSGTGNGTVNYTIAVNPSSSPRTASVFVAGLVFSITQLGASGCTLTPISINQVVSGSLANTDCQSPIRGNGYFADRYTFTGTTNQAVAIRGSASYLGVVHLLGPDGLVVASNGLDFTFTSTPRIPAAGGFLALPANGTYTIEVTSYSTNVTGNYGLSLTSGTAGCSYEITTPSSRSFNAAGGSGNIAVTTGGTCGWTAITDANWVTINGGSSGIGNGTVNYTIGVNSSGSPRTANVFVAGLVFSITQLGDGGFCALTPISPGQTVNASLANTDCQSPIRGSGYFADRYTFTGTTSQAVAIRASASYLGVIHLLGPDGLVVASNGLDFTFTTTPRIPAAGGFLALPANGTYTIEVTSYSTNITGNYSLSLTTGTVGCSYAITPNNQSIGPAGGPGSIAVTTGGACAWTAITDANWVTINGGSSGTGNGTVNYTVAPNPSSSPRTASVLVAGLVFNITQLGDASFCSLIPITSGQTINGSLANTDCQSPVRGSGYFADRYSFTGTANQGVAISLTSSSFDTYLYLLAPDGTVLAADDDGAGGGNSRIPTTGSFFTLPSTGTYIFEATSFGTGRTGSYAVSLTTGQTNCTYNISPNVQNFSSSGGSGSVTVTTAPACGWTASSNSPFLTITSSPSSGGSGTMNYLVAANPNLVGRSGTLTIAGQTFTVTQNASTACSFSINPTSRSFNASGGSGTISVTALAGCSWTATSNSGFINVNSGASGSGNGIVSYVISANTTGGSRTGTVTAAGQVFTVDQSADSPSVRTITLISPLPKISDPIIIDGTTQPGYAGAPIIEITGVNLSSIDGGNGLNITAGNSTIRSLAINRFTSLNRDSGILLISNGNNIVEGCYLGADKTGKGAFVPNGTNATSAGLSIRSSSGNLIGGTTAAARNLISGVDGAGVIITSGATNNLVQGNYIGSDAAGSFSLGFQRIGVYVQGASGNTIGGTAAGAGNLISGNIDYGVYLQDNARNNLVVGNMMGTNGSGAGAVSNGNAGVFIYNPAGTAAPTLDNTIGGTTPAARNIISGNDPYGIVLGQGATGTLVQGNYIGTKVSGTAALPNTYGITATQATGSTIGGAVDAARNVISGNTLTGVSIGFLNNGQLGGTGTTIQGNYIGTNASGTGAVGNQADGVFVEVQSITHIIQDNLIAFNGNNGITIPANSNPAFKITITSNKIFANSLTAIDLGDAGDTPNDDLDTDDGANTLQNYPELQTASQSILANGVKGADSQAAASVTVNYRLRSSRNSTFNVEFFASNGSCISKQFTSSGERMGSEVVSTDVNGIVNRTITLSLPPTVSAPVSMLATATATSVPPGTIGVSAGNTSEMSQCLSVAQWQSVVLTAQQIAEIKAWTVGGRTFVYVKPQFPDAGYRVVNWGQVTRTGNDFTVDAIVEKFTGASIQAVVTTAQIYDLGPLPNATYNFNFKTSGTLAKTLQFTVGSATPPPNTIDTAREFVRQQYRDFLNREADQAGEDFWTDNITLCSNPARRPAGQTEAQCTLRQRETTSGAFFQSPEFQYTGYFVYRMYQGALGRQPKLSEFTPDAQFVGAGILVNGQLSGAKINQNKADFAAQFVNCTDATKYRCAEFKAIYDKLNNQQYVDALFVKTGANPSASERAALVNGLNAGPATETRASVLQKVVDGIVVIGEGNQTFTTTYGQAFYNSESNRAFVLLEYFGYMKRDPDDAGYAFWLSKLNQFNGNFVNAEMVLAFISSPEYRARFGQP